MRVVKVEGLSAPLVVLGAVDDANALAVDELILNYLINVVFIVDDVLDLLILKLDDERSVIGVLGFLIEVLDLV